MMTEYERDHSAAESEDGATYFCRFTFGQFFTIFMLAIVTLIFSFYMGARFGHRYLRKAENVNKGPRVIEVVGGNVDTIPESIRNDRDLMAVAQKAIDADKEGTLKARLIKLLEDEKKNSSTISVSNLPPPMPKAAVQNQELFVPTSQPARQEPVRVTNQPEQTTARIDHADGLPFSVQVGSYQDIKEANFWVAEWRTRGYNSFMMIADLPDRGRWYRVRLGGFASRPEAENYLEKFKGRESADAIIVQNQ